jgi:hypothetical protein
MYAAGIVREPGSCRYEQTSCHGFCALSVAIGEEVLSRP